MYNSVGYIRRFYFALKTNVIYHIWFAKKRQMHERVKLDREVLEQRRLEILPSLITMKPALDKISRNVDKLCNICYIRPKEATFVHGNISHQVCCYPCAKAIFNQKRTCPVCRRQIEKITKLFCL